MLEMSGAYFLRSMESALCMNSSKISVIHTNKYKGKCLIQSKAKLLIAMKYKNKCTSIFSISRRANNDIFDVGILLKIKKYSLVPLHLFYKYVNFIRICLSIRYVLFYDLLSLLFLGNFLRAGFLKMIKQSIWASHLNPGDAVVHGKSESIFMSA